MPADPERVQAVFLTLAAVPIADRAAALDLACGTDGELRQRVEALLQAHDAPGSFLDQPGVAPAPTEASEVSEPSAGSLPAEDVGTQIGPYKLLQRLGEGGMGTVWVAEQQRPVKRRVALKIVKPGLDSTQVLRRFEAERQALALMDHTHIAKVFDAGSTASGRPYFVMELVHGVPITKYCDELNLSIRERLELFVPVCQAIQHAHQKGVIHRDVKPSNVLVCLQDGKPVAKVIDFGVAKAMNRQLTEDTVYTEFGAVVGTLEYMAPEQAEVSALGVDTRADVYALGVLLYELLTGTTPLDRKRLKQAAFLEVLRLIKEEEPPKPSTRLSESQETLASVAARRRTEPARLTKQVRGELDWIVMRCLEKDRTRRYESASALARDIERHLADEPVEACPPSAGYRLRKFLRRYRGPVLAVSLIVLLLVMGIVGTTIGLLWALAEERQALKERDDKDESRRQAVASAEAEAQARRQARQALNAMTDEVVEDLLKRQVQLTDQHRQFLNMVLASYEAFAAGKRDDPEGIESRADGYFRVGKVRQALGELKDAEAAYQEALPLWRQLVHDVPDHPEYGQRLVLTLNNLALLQRDTGRPKEAEAALLEALPLAKDLAARYPEQPDLRQLLPLGYNNLGMVFYKNGRLKDAETHFTDALTLYKQITEDFPGRAEMLRLRVLTYDNLAILLRDSGRTAQAEAAFKEALALRKELLRGSPDPESRRGIALTHANLGILLAANGRVKEAETEYLESLTLFKQLAAGFPNRAEFRQGLAFAHDNLGSLYRETGRASESEKAYRESLAIRQQLVDDFPGRPEFRQALALGHNNLGALLRTIGRPQDAEKCHGEALAIRKQLTGEFPNRPDFLYDLAQSYHNLGNVLTSTGRLEQAETIHREALAAYKQLADRFPDQLDYVQPVAWIHDTLAEVQRKTGREKEAQANLQEALAIRRKLLARFPKVPDVQFGLASTLTQLAVLQQRRREFASAVSLLEEARTHYQAALAATPRNPTYRLFYRNSLELMARCLVGLSDHDRLATTAEELARFDQNPPKDTCLAAGFICHCIGLAEKDSQLPNGRRTDLVQSYGDRAMALVRQAVARGYKDANQLKKTPGLQPLRERDDFKKLLTELEAGGGKPGTDDKSVRP
jgi:serine/threonine protein kinase/tetratricopeptide (TPR) repeat protein